VKFRFGKAADDGSVLVDWRMHQRAHCGER
jgi:hypothetical protein